MSEIEQWIFDNEKQILGLWAVHLETESVDLQDEEELITAAILLYEQLNPPFYDEEFYEFINILVTYLFLENLRDKGLIDRSINNKYFEKKV